MSDADFTAEKQKEYLDSLILSLMKDGKDINEVLKMPYHFVIELLRERNKPKESKSLIAAFGG
ncbi:hypothetical protein JOC75_004009 [Metabacillus crassostreae]|uniref:phage tail assembly chaperone GT n=1 Tax=Metabacillus crassostreae TaxID=929098 RepID=UPI00195E2BA4|nr:hypothetical protein [Metabacillus crassostreae]MBM7605981.1 hypothetical protein [Metabacillus crassostreae]